MRYLATALFLLFAVSAFANTAEYVGAPSPFVMPDGTAQAPDVRVPVVYCQNELVTHPGQGFAGADASALQTALGLTIYGFGHQVLNDNRIADDFTIPGPCTVQLIKTYAYQTGAPTSGTITGVSLEIWDGVPGASTRLYGNIDQNFLFFTGWSNIYRTLDTDIPTANGRAIMENWSLPDNPAGWDLAGGTYWLAWQTDGSLSSGPWAPPRTLLGEMGLGNGLQSIAGAAYTPALDGSTQQGFPFCIDGECGATPVEASTWGAIKASF